MKSFLACITLAISALVLAPACERDSEAGRTFDCAKICSKYSECMKTLDVISCTSECEDQADANSGYQNKAVDCTECTSDKTCKEAEPCWAGCPTMPAVSM